MLTQPNFDWSASAIRAEAEALIAETTETWTRVGEMPLEVVTFENFILPIALAENEFESRFGVIGWFADVSADDNIREASAEIRLKLASHRQSLWKRHDVFAAVNTIWAKQRQKCTLDAESSLYLDLLRRKFVDGGLALLNGESVARLGEIEEELKTASSKYRRELDEKRGLWMTIDELAGVPQSALLGCEAEEERRYIPLRVATYGIIIKYAHHEDTRKKMEIAYNNRAKDTNPALLHRLAVLRDEQARLLGYKHYADWKTAERMMSPTRALGFLQDAAERLAGPVKSRIKTLKAIKSMQPQHYNSSDSSVENIYTWDLSYYERLCRQEQFLVDEAALQAYFPFDQVLDRVLQIQGAAFGFTLEKLETDYPRNAWHKDVAVYKIWHAEANEAQEGFVGYFYVDVYARDFKFGHRVSTYALTNPCLARDGSRIYPSSIFLANYMPPENPETPHMMSFTEVITCFHEVGHSFHNFSKTTNFWRLAVCAMDFVEIPSILLEHFFWHPSIIRFISGRRDADGRDEKLRLSMVEQLISSRFAGDVMHKASLVRDGIIDLQMHMPDKSHDIVAMDIVRQHNTLTKQICGLADPVDAGLEPDASKAISRCRFPIQYPASYYAYFLARAISYDVFETKFRSLMPPVDAVTLDQLISPALKEEFQRYQKIILQPGGKLAGRYMDAIEQYLGKEPAVDAWIKQLDLAA